MNSKMKNESPYSSIELIRFVIKWKWVLGIMFVLSAIAAIIFSSPYFITPLYKSTVIMYPSAPSSASRTLVSENSANNDLLEIGEEEQTEQMLQLLHSNLIRDRVIAKYDLLTHYEIKPDSRYFLTRLNKEYQSNFKFSRTEYMAVQITVWDKDPQLAADMANEIAELIDSTKNYIQHERATKGFDIVKREYESLQNEIRVKEDSLTKLREFGIHDYETQAEMINQQLAKELADGNTSAIQRLEKRLSVLAKYGSSYVSLRDALEFDIEQLSVLRSKFNEARIDAEEFLPQKFIVNKAFKAEKKSYPARWLIIVLSCISVTFLTFLLLLFIKKISSMDLTANEN